MEWTGKINISRGKLSTIHSQSQQPKQKHWHKRHGKLFFKLELSKAHTLEINLNFRDSLDDNNIYLATQKEEKKRKTQR